MGSQTECLSPKTTENFSQDLENLSNRRRAGWSIIHPHAGDRQYTPFHQTYGASPLALSNRHQRLDSKSGRFRRRVGFQIFNDRLELRPATRF
jgi:hypothetical protein